MNDETERLYDGQYTIDCEPHDDSGPTKQTTKDDIIKAIEDMSAPELEALIEEAQKRLLEK